MLSESLANMLQEIEIDPINICNRSCSFCPRSKDYKNTKEKLSIDTSKSINESLKELNYSNDIAFCGFGEPLLHKRLEENISTILSGIHPRKVLVISNGDRINRTRLLSLKESGVTNIRISLYDEDTSPKFLEMNQGIDLEMGFRHNYQGIKNEVNRNEIVRKTKITTSQRPCFLPFWTTIIDYNGDVLLCCNDWTKRNKFGNVNSISLKDIWASPNLNLIRDRLKKAKRDLFPCSSCDINGCLSGKKQFDTYIKVTNALAKREMGA